jgi:NAD(P)-dependent dehydrogenase (short-subunit alcohol dehydrogenase family)
MNILITGANSGIGFSAAMAIAKAKPTATIYLGCRNPERGQEALRRLKEAAPQSQILFDLPLDLSDLQSIQRFSNDLKSKVKHLDILINNAGVMGIPRRQTTPQGFEQQFGTNHLGHFALTSHLMPLLLKSPNGIPRVVTVSSIYAQKGKVRIDDFGYEKGYKPYGAYADSKLANLVFAKELQRRAQKANVKLVSVCVHPGYTATNLQTSGTEYPRWLVSTLNKMFAQSEEQGCLPTLYGAFEEAAMPGGFYGPDGRWELQGKKVKEAKTNPLALDEELARKQWEASAKAVGVSEDFFKP